MYAYLFKCSQRPILLVWFCTVVHCFLSSSFTIISLEEGNGCFMFYCDHDFINLCIFACLFSTVYSVSFCDVVLDHHLNEEEAGCYIFYCVRDFINLCILVCLFSTVYFFWFYDVVRDHHLTEEEASCLIFFIVSVIS